MLPTQKTPPKRNLHDLTVLMYAAHKFGKSSWCAQADSALFLATEPGLNHLEVYQQPISTWDELLNAAKEVADGKHTFRTVIIDTVDNAYRMCAEYICRRHEVEHESDLEYGKGYALVNSEFHRVLNKLALLPYGLFLVSHAQEKEIETRTGKYTKIVPTLPDKARKLVLGLVDIILFGDLEPTTTPDGKPGYRRVLRTKPSAAYEAGDRTGRLPEVLDLDFTAFASAFAEGTARAASRDTTAAAAPASTPTTNSASPASSPPADSASPASSPRADSRSSPTTTTGPATARSAKAPVGPAARPRTAAPTTTPAPASTAASSDPTAAAPKPRTTSTGNR